MNNNEENKEIKIDPKYKENKGKGIGFMRLRRVTGYLAGDVSRFNNSKRAEEKDRVKHTFDSIKKEEEDNNEQ